MVVDREFGIRRVVECGGIERYMILDAPNRISTWGCRMRLKARQPRIQCEVMRVEIPRVAPSHEFQTPFEITFSVFEYDVTEINLGIRV